MHDSTCLELRAVYAPDCRGMVDYDIIACNNQVGLFGLPGGMQSGENHPVLHIVKPVRLPGST